MLASTLLSIDWKMSSDSSFLTLPALTIMQMSRLTLSSSKLEP